ncbi:MAG: hypothetical protein JWM02_2466 [Frankiales bacterium]|nr:hypothetical protein [Frankiales bacterium]
MDRSVTTTTSNECVRYHGLSWPGASRGDHQGGKGLPLTSRPRADGTVRISMVAT